MGRHPVSTRGPKKDLPELEDGLNAQNTRNLMYFSEAVDAIKEDPRSHPGHRRAVQPNDLAAAEELRRD
jgi:hypothetical protein